MAVDIKVPAVGESVSEGVIAEWNVNEGDHVKRDDPLFELETDKVTMTINAEQAGKVSIKVEAGETVEVGQVVGSIDTNSAPPEGKAVTQRREAAELKQRQQASAGDDEQKTDQKKKSDSQPSSSETTTATAPEETSGGDDGSRPESRESATVRGPLAEAISPSLRRLMREHKLQPSDVKGSGQGGRITREDIERAAGQGPQAPAADRTGPTPPASAGSDGDRPRQVRKPMTPLRKRIATRLVEAQQTAAMLTTFNEVDMSGVMELRKRYNANDAFQKKHGVKLGFMSFFVKAVVEALKSVPAVNAMIDGTDIVENHYYDIGIAVSTEKGLVVPVIRDADRQSFGEIEQSIGDLAKRARDRKLTLEDLSGGVFTITNGGIFGSMLSTPILNPPQSAILGMHAIKKRAVVMPDDSIVARPMMYLAMSYDHRLVDGAEAVTFLKRIVECIEDPERILLEI